MAMSNLRFVPANACRPLGRRHWTGRITCLFLPLILISACARPADGVPVSGQVIDAGRKTADAGAATVDTTVELAQAGAGGGQKEEPTPKKPATKSPIPPASKTGGAKTVKKPADIAADPAHPFPRRIKAPRLEGGVAWLNTAGPLEIEQLRGKFVMLDFWTYCCINCMHILPELKKLEHAFPNELVVIGVHSAKFDNEKNSRNIQEAVLRYEIEHPVVDDSNLAIWNSYGVNTWPSLRIIDPEGNLVAGNSGEITFEDLQTFFKQVIPYYRKKGVLDETPLRFDLEA